MAAPDEVGAQGPEAEKTDAAAQNAAAEGTEAEDVAPVPDPQSCRGIALSMDVFEQAVLDGEFDGTEFLYYLEPAGVLNANLVCSRRYPAESVRAGILMTRQARETKTVFFDDGINPERYELHFPKEFGYVKSIQHYQPQSREHAKYPWSKKY